MALAARGGNVCKKRCGLELADWDIYFEIIWRRRTVGDLGHCDGIDDEVVVGGFFFWGEVVG